MWRVTADFADLRDGGHLYKVGDKYPRKGVADPLRVIQLSGRNNARGMSLIEFVKETKKRKAE